MAAQATINASLGHRSENVIGKPRRPLINYLRCA